MPTATDSRVPDDVWALSWPEQLDWFSHLILTHDALTVVSRELQTIMQPPVVQPLVFLVGPSGVGKSTLLTKLVTKVYHEAMSGMEADPSWIPVTGVELVAPDSGTFDWLDFYRRSLQALREPLIDKKSFPKLPRPRDPKREWRACFEDALKYRRPEFFFIDEAQHLLKIRRRNAIDQTDSLKSLVSHTRVPLLLTGTYDVLDLVDLSEQLGRRGQVRHFPRYDVSNATDRKEFQTFILTVQTHLPFKVQPDLVRHWRYLYQQTLGVCGVLHDWVIAASKLAHAEQAPLALEHLERTERRWTTVETAYKEIVKGEQKMQTAIATRDRLARELGLRKAAAPESPPPPHQAETDQSQSSAKANAKASKKKPGQRKPSRDPVNPLSPA